jgi:mRNA interferase MazF
MHPHDDVGAPQSRHRSPAGHNERMTSDVISQGDVYWIEADRLRPYVPGPSHPHAVVQTDALNASRISTVVVCALTSNMKRANEPSNVPLDPDEAGLSRPSIVVVGQVSTVEKADLGEYVGTLSAARVEQILFGMRFQQRSFFEG